MKRGWILFVTLCFFVHASALHAAEKGISVTASGTVKVSPDMAVFRAVISSTESDAKKAASRTAEIWGGVQKALRVAGIPVEDSPSAGYTVNPEWVWDGTSNRNVLKGYTARHDVLVTVRDLKLTGAAVDAVLRAGAGTVEGIRFSSSRADSLRRSALDIAVRSARRDADIIAAAAGGRIGALQELVYGQQTPVRPFSPEPMMMKSMAENHPTEIAPAEEEITETVQSRWSFITPTGK
jgi:hypothetical protein